MTILAPIFTSFSRDGAISREQRRITFPLHARINVCPFRPRRIIIVAPPAVTRAREPCVASAVCKLFVPCRDVRDTRRWCVAGNKRQRCQEGKRQPAHGMLLEIPI